MSSTINPHLHQLVAGRTEHTGEPIMHTDLKGVVASPTPRPKMLPHTGVVVTWNALIGVAILAAIVSFVAGCLTARARLPQPPSDEAPEAVPAVSWIWFVLGVGALCAHALLVPHPIDETWQPSFDNTALFWAIFAVAGFVFPIVTDVSLPGGFGLKISRREVRIRYLASTHLLDELSDVMQNWSTALERFLAFLETGEADRASVRAALVDFLRLRAFEAIEWVGSDKEERRLSLWIYDDKAKRLRFLHSNEITDADTLDATFELGEGLLGAAFIEDRVWNERVASEVPGYKVIRNQWPPKYNGLLLIPIHYGVRKIGMLSVDRTAPEYFPDTQVNLFKALAAIVGSAIEDPRLKRILESAE